MESNTVFDQPLVNQPLFDPRYLNLEYLFYKILQLFRAIVDFFGPDLLAMLYTIIKILISLITIGIIIFGIYSYLRYKELHEAEQKKLKTIMKRPPAPTPRNTRWLEVERHIKSNNPSDWRLAIIEADTMLDEMVLKMPHRGENLGERLKSIEPSDFFTLNDAWEAHKVRNRIAHEGSAFEIDHKEAKRVIGLYEKVFREFMFI